MTHDADKDGDIDREDQLAEWRDRSQRETDAMWAGFFASIAGLLAPIGRAAQTLVDALRALPQTIRRARVRVAVQFVPEDVTDSQQLYDRTFFSLPVNSDHEHYRRTICSLALLNRTQEQDLQFAQYLRGMKDYNEDPVRIWIERAWAKYKAPSTKPVAEVQSFMGAPVVPGLSFLSQALAALLVGVAVWGLWRNSAAEDAQDKLDEAQEELAGATVRADAIAGRLQQAEQAIAQSRAVQEDFEKRVQAQARLDAQRAIRQRELARKAQERKDAIAQGDGAGGSSDDQWLRDLTQLASIGGGAPVPPDPASTAAAGVLNGVPGEGGPDAGAADLPKN